VTTVEKATSSGALPRDSFSLDAAAAACPTVSPALAPSTAAASAPLLALSGDAKALAALVATAPPAVTRQLELLVGPTPPDRLQLMCMRHGGPATELNRNPVCRGVNQKTPPGTTGAWSDLPPIGPA
jgi:hypothetical protein